MSSLKFADDTDVFWILDQNSCLLAMMSLSHTRIDRIEKYINKTYMNRINMVDTPWKNA